jgi:GH43 family beta-xylosidase
MVKQLFENPIVWQKADPWVYKHTDGYYYFSASVKEFDRIEIRKSKTINGLGSAFAKVVWEKHQSGIMSANIWAPEIHFIEGKWYIYFAAAYTSQTQDGLYDHRIYVLENQNADPLEGKWIEKGQIATRWETFSLDATTFEHNHIRYLVWAQKDPQIQGNSNLYIARLLNPWTIDGNQVMLSTPEYEWEKIGFMVNEGPAVLKKNGKIFITYSASATDSNYCIGLLTADETADLLNPISWNKSSVPVFKSCEGSNIYGPGHNSFTFTEDGNTVMIYHARTYREIEGNPLYDPNRHTFAQMLFWNNDGTPDFEEQMLSHKLLYADQKC